VHVSKAYASEPGMRAKRRYLGADQRPLANSSSHTPVIDLLTACNSRGVGAGLRDFPDSGTLQNAGNCSPEITHRSFDGDDFNSLPRNPP
jgi:hypothetical protein